MSDARSKLKSAASKAGKIKLAFFDIDGTIYRADHSISNETVAAIETLKSRGIKVCLATGRPYFGAKKIIEQLAISESSVFFSGALAINPATGQIAYSATISSQEVKALADELNSAEIYFEFYTFDKYYVEKTNHITEIHNTYLHQPPIVSAISDVYSQGPFYKLVAISENGAQVDRLRSIALQFPQFSYAFSSGATHPEILFMNVTNSLASREVVFEEMLQHFNVSSEEVIAFGDSEADLAFLNKAGIGVTLENAPLSVQQRSPYITKSVEEDGVVVALQLLGLI